MYGLRLCVQKEFPFREIYLNNSVTTRQEEGEIKLYLLKNHRLN